MTTPEPDRIAAYRTFCQSIEAGHTLKEALQASGLAWGTVQRWIANDSHTLPLDDTTDPLDPSLGPLDRESFASRYARARLVSASSFEDRAQEEAERATPETVQVARLRVDTYKWRASVANPKEYGSKQSVEVSGTVGHLHMDALRSGKLTAKATLSNPATPLLSSSLTPDDVSPKEDTDQ